MWQHRKENSSEIRSESFFSPKEVKLMHDNLLEAKKFHHKIKNLTLIAHRGMGPSSISGSTFGPNVIPENTLTAFKQAIIFGADGIEFDIFKSSDDHIMVIHDDELWRNVYGQDREGELLPPNETRESYKVGKKTLETLKQLSVGQSGERIPTLTEVFDLAADANKIRFKASLPPLILNIELKDSTAITFCLDVVNRYIDNHPSSGINFDSICFCSFNHDSLIALKQEANKRKIINIKIAPAIKTITLFGKDNVNPKNFVVKENSKYDKNALKSLKKLVVEHEFTAYDAVLWDIYAPLIALAQKTKKQLHASTSDYRNYDEPHQFANFLLLMCKQVCVYFKCDEIRKARTLLLETTNKENWYNSQIALSSRQETVDLDVSGRFLLLDEHLSKPIKKEENQETNNAEIKITIEKQTQTDQTGLKTNISVGLKNSIYTQFIHQPRKTLLFLFTNSGDGNKAAPPVLSKSVRRKSPCDSCNIM